MPKSRGDKLLYGIILIAYMALGALFAIYTPAWQSPDEPAHTNYARQIAEAGCCPVIETGDWDSAYLSKLTGGRFAPDLLGELDTIQYEDHHPPLYYLLASLVYHLSAGDLVALRLFSVLLGAGVVALSYAVAREVLPKQTQIALGVMALVAFLPQHLHMLSSVNNDALAELVVAAALLLIARMGNRSLPDQTPPPGPLSPSLWRASDASGRGSSSASIRYVFGLGLTVGIAFLTKLTIYFLAPLCALAIWLHWRSRGGARSEFARQILVCALVAGAIGGIWWLRNISVYGFPDLFGLAAHDAVVQDQLRTADYMARHGFSSTLSNALGTIFKSFVGQFGWMALPLDGVLGGWIYRGFGLLALVGLAGGFLSARAIRQSQRNIILIFCGAAVLVALQVAYYNLEFVQWQGRYLYPALIPIALALVGGLEYWRGRLLGRWAASKWLLPLGLMGLAALDVYLLFRVIVPGLSP